MKKNNESKASKVIKAAGIAGAAIGGAAIPTNMVMAQEIEENEITGQLEEEELQIQQERSQVESVALASPDLGMPVGPSEEFILENTSLEPVPEVISEEIVPEIIEEEETSNSPYAEYDKLLKELENATEENQAAAEQAVAKSIIGLNSDGAQVTEISDFDQDGKFTVTYKSGDETEVTKKFRYENVDGEIKVIELTEELTVNKRYIVDADGEIMPKSTYEGGKDNLHYLFGAPQISFEDSDGKPVVTVDGNEYTGSYTEEDGKYVFVLEEFDEEKEGKTLEIEKDGSSAKVILFTNTKEEHTTGTGEPIDPEQTKIFTSNYNGYDFDTADGVDDLFNEKKFPVVRDAEGNLRRLRDAESNELLTYDNSLSAYWLGTAFKYNGVVIKDAHHIGVVNGQHCLLDKNGGIVKELIVDGETTYTIKTVKTIFEYNKSVVDGKALDEHYAGYEEHKKAEEERKAKEEADRLAKEEADRLAKEEADRLAKEEADRLAKEEADRLAKEEADRLAKEEADRLAKEEADRLAKEEADRLAKEEADRLAKEEADRLAKEEADRLAKEEADRLAKEEADRLAKEEADRIAQEEADRIAQEEADKEGISGNDNINSDASDEQDVAPEVTDTEDEDDVTSEVTDTVDTENVAPEITDTQDAPTDGATYVAPASVAPVAPVAQAAPAPVTPVDQQVPLAEVNLGDVETPLGNLQVGDVVELDDVETPQSAIALGTAAWWSAIPLVGAAASIGERIKGNKKQKADSSEDIIEGLDDDIK